MSSACPSLIDRRRFLLAGTALAAIGPARAQQSPAPPVLADGGEFDRSAVVELARNLAKRPYAAGTPTLPDWLSGLTQEQYQAIRIRPERAVWRDQNRGLTLEPLHRGFVYQVPVQLFLIEDGRNRRLAYSPSAFELGRLTPPPNAADIAFSGFRLVRHQADEPAREIAVFQGATFLRAAARFQSQGVISRALSLRTADPRGEEFPAFRAFWIEDPVRNDIVVVHALLDSESVSGAYTFTIRIGDVTLIDTEATIFPRVALDNIGIAGMQATYLFAPGERRSQDDYRPAVYEVSGLQMLTGAGEWVWRPLTNPRQLQISAFGDENPRGFGLVQRDREFSVFLDHEARLEARPTLWIEPIGDWKTGSVHLVEIPSDTEIHDNIIAHWRPKDPMQPGSEHMFAYRQHWTWAPPDRPGIGTVVSTRTGRTAGGRRRRFTVDFAGERLSTAKPADVSVDSWASNSGISNLRLIHGAGGKVTRVAFDLDPGSEALIELRLQLKSGDTPLSETWLYRWTA